jgi:long-chain acyl-CoA synthetase
VRGGRERGHAGTIPGMFFSQTSRLGERPAFFEKRAGRFLPITYGEAGETVRKLAAGLVDLGVRPGDRVAIISYNRPEWVMADLAVLSAGAVTVPVYHTSTRAQSERILQRAGVRVAFVSRSEKAEMLLTCDAALETMISLDPKGKGDPGSCALDYPRLRELGAAKLGMKAGREVQKRLARLGPDDLATVVFTSGTTGEPKGVMLSHRNLLSNAAAGLAAQPVGEEDLYLSFLPLSHLFERSIGYYLMVLAGVPIAYAESVRTVAADARTVRPTVMLAVPRFLEKVQEKVMNGVMASPAWKRVLFRLAMTAGLKLHPGGGKGREAGVLSRLAVTAADMVVFRRIRDALGGRLRFIICGGAPLAAEIVDFFLAAGINVLEGYGLSEASPVISVNRLGRVRPGTVGVPFENIEVKTASDGEIIVKGPSVMMGYLDDEKATAEAIRDGWLHTGDTGVVEDGYLRITGRKKDIIVTSGGKNVSPQRVEGLLEGDDCVSRVVVYGDRRKYLTALVVPDYARLRREMGEESLRGLGNADLARRRDVYAFLMERINRRSRDLASFEQVRKIVVLDAPLTEDRGEVTPTMKVRRDRVTGEFRERLEALYE